MSKAKRRTIQREKAKKQNAAGLTPIGVKSVYNDAEISEKAVVIDLALSSCPEGELKSYGVANKGLCLININKEYFEALMKLGLDNYAPEKTERILDLIKQSNTVIIRLEKTAPQHTEETEK